MNNQGILTSFQLSIMEQFKTRTWIGLTELSQKMKLPHQELLLTIAQMREKGLSIELNEGKSEEQVWVPSKEYSYGRYLLDKYEIYNTFLGDYARQDFPYDNFHIILSVDSTNTVVKDKSAPYLLLAEQQTHGKGRYGRDWKSPFAQGIYLSMNISITKFMQGIQGLSLALGVMCTQFFTTLGLNIGLKWPNDLVLTDNLQTKLGGILVEVCDNSVIIGIGINYSYDYENAVSIAKLYMNAHNNRLPPPRSSVLAKLIDQLVAGLRIFYQEGFEKFYEEWNKVDALVGNKVIIKGADNNEPKKGICRGVNELGALLLQDNDKIYKVASGSVNIV